MLGRIVGLWCDNLTIGLHSFRLPRDQITEVAGWED
jgi:hypothetical protein